MSENPRSGDQIRSYRREVVTFGEVGFEGVDRVVLGGQFRHSWASQLADGFGADAVGMSRAELGS